MTSDDPTEPASTAAVKKRASSADVARACGVSRATVSYVLNDTPGHAISAATRELVLRTAREMGHMPYAPARMLRRGRSDIVLALVRDFGLGYVSNEILSRLDVALAKHGYVVLVHRLDESLRSVSELWGMVSPELVVVMGAMTGPDQQAIEGTQTKLLKTHGVVSSQRTGRLQVDYLHGKGHRRLGFAYSDADAVQLVARDRLQGAIEVTTELGLPGLAVAHVDPSEPETVRRAVESWVGGPDPVTAVCAHNDEIALMILECLYERGLTPGVDLAVIGADDIPAARINLTTVRVKIDQWSDAVVRGVHEMLKGAEAPDLSGDYVEVIERTSA